MASIQIVNFLIGVDYIEYLAIGSQMQLTTNLFTTVTSNYSEINIRRYLGILVGTGQETRIIYVSAEI